MGTKMRRRRLYRIFVRPGAQFKLFVPFLIFMMTWTAIMLVAAWVFHGMLDRLSGPAGSLSPTEIVDLQILNKNLIRVLVWGSGASVVLSFSFWLAFSHNVFGPMVQIHKQIDRLKNGDMDGQVRLRPRDEFQNVAASVNELTEQLKVAKGGGSHH